MNVKQLKEYLNTLPDHVEVDVWHSVFCEAVPLDKSMIREFIGDEYFTESIVINPEQHFYEGVDKK